VTSIGDTAESGDIAFCVNPALFSNGCDITGELREVEKTDFMSVGGIVKSQGRATGTCS